MADAAERRVEITERGVGVGGCSEKSGEDEEQRSRMRRELLHEGALDVLTIGLHDQLPG
jgi:hypothetical protein